MPLPDVLARFHDVREENGHHTAQCPLSAGDAHPHRLRIFIERLRNDTEVIEITCRPAGMCHPADVRDAVGVTGAMLRATIPVEATAPPPLVEAAPAASGTSQTSAPLPTDPIALLSHLRTVCGLTVALTRAGTVSVKPKHKITDEIRDAIAAVGIPALLAALEAERPEPVPDAAPPDDGRPEMNTDVGDLKTYAAQVWGAIRQTNDPPTLLQNAGVLVRTERDDDGRPFLRPLEFAHLKHDLVQRIFWYKVIDTEKGRRRVADRPSGELTADLLATADKPVPLCRRVVTVPIYTRDARLITRPGYDAGAHVMYAPPAGFALPPVPERPTPADIAAARDALMEPFDEFPYLDAETGRAHVLAALLTTFVREFIDGPTPLFLIVKPVPGAGATLIVCVIVLIVSGTVPTVMPPADDDAEWRKRLTSILLAARDFIFLDNLRTLDSPSLATALTAPSWDDRVLGGNTLVSIPIRATWMATGNNVRLTTEQWRRTVRIELDAPSERPWLRHLAGEGSYTHQDLQAWALAERPRLIAAALTLVRAWIVEGQPSGSITLGTYESWSRVLGGILNVADVKGFLGNIADSGDVDDETLDFKRFVAAWWAKHGDDPETAADLFTLATSVEIAFPLAGDSDHARRTRFGKLLHANRNRVFDLDALTGLTVKILRPDSARHDHKATWRLKQHAEREGVRGVARGSRHCSTGQKDDFVNTPPRESVKGGVQHREEPLATTRTPSQHSETCEERDCPLHEHERAAWMPPQPPAPAAAGSPA